MRDSSDERTLTALQRDQLIRWGVAAGFVIAYLILALRDARLETFPNQIDELAHLSYIVHLAQVGLRHLDISAMFLMKPDLTHQFTDQLNYLNHPPFYYLMLGSLLPPDGWPTSSTVLTLRMVNVGLSGTAVAFALSVGIVRRLEVRIFLLYCALVVLVPVLPVIGGGVSNDNLVFLGGSMTVAGAQMVQSNEQVKLGWAIAIVGCLLATLAKLTGCMLTTGFIGLFILIRWTAGVRPPWRVIVALGLVQAVAMVPYAWFIVRYGSPAPLIQGFAEAYRQITTMVGSQPLRHVRGWDATAQVGVARYAVQFIVWLFLNWTTLFTMSGLPEAAMLAGPAAVLLIAGWAWVRNLILWRQGDALLMAGSMTLAAIFPIHLAFSWHMHLAFGAPPFDAVPRYYLPLALTVVPAAACWTLQRLNGPIRVAAIWALFIAIAVGTPLMNYCGDGSCNGWLMG